MTDKQIQVISYILSEVRDNLVLVDDVYIENYESWAMTLTAESYKELCEVIKSFEEFKNNMKRG